MVSDLKPEKHPSCFTDGLLQVAIPIQLYLVHPESYLQALLLKFLQVLVYFHHYFMIPGMPNNIGNYKYAGEKDTKDT